MDGNDAIAQVKAYAAPELTWLQKHERLVRDVALALIVVLAGYGLVNHYLNNAAEHDRQAATAQAQVLQAQKETNAQLAAQVQKTADQYTALVASVTQQNTQLAAQVQARSAALQAQQTKDTGLDAAGVAARLTALETLQAGQAKVTAAPLGPAGATGSTGGSVTLDQSAGQKVVSDLDSIPVLQQNLADTKSSLNTCRLAMDAGDKLEDARETQIAGLNKQIADQDTSCKATVTSLKAEARKSKWNWFWRGLAVGGAAVTAIVAFLAVHGL